MKEPMKKEWFKGLEKERWGWGVQGGSRGLDTIGDEYVAQCRDGSAFGARHLDSASTSGQTAKARRNKVLLKGSWFSLFISYSDLEDPVPVGDRTDEDGKIPSADFQFSYASSNC